VMHGAQIALVGVIVWVIDIVGRNVVASYKHKGFRMAAGRVVAEGVVELRFSKEGFRYSEGQFVWLTVPEISVWEQHPFSISSAPHQEEVTIHTKALGDWTTALLKHCQSTKKVAMFIEGPYGCPSFSITEPDQDVFVFVAGGIGATPMISYANSLINQIVKGRPIKKLYFFWSVRDRHLPNAFDFRDALLFKLASEHCPATLDRDVFKKLLEIVDVRVHLTGKVDSTVTSDFEIAPNSSIFLHTHRMTIKAYLDEVKAWSTAHTASKVSVFCCGPKTMLQKTSRKCKRLGFAHHIENFEL